MAKVTIVDDICEEPESVKLVIDPVDIENNALFVQELGATDGILPSPIDINVMRMTKINLPNLKWHNYDALPKKMKLTNSGETLILSAKWQCERPYLSGGPLNGKYVFSQIHFHWGRTATEGSEHTIDETRMPLEMHAIHFKSAYLNQNEALKHQDGIICLVYMFQIRSNHNPTMHLIVSSLYDIRMADTAISIEPFVITKLIYPFEYDFYMYWGNVRAASTLSTILWFIARAVESLSFEQLCLFRQLLDPTLRPIIRNWREINCLNDRLLLHVNPAYVYTNSTLAPTPLRLHASREFMMRKEEQDAARVNNLSAGRKAALENSTS